MPQLNQLAEVAFSQFFWLLLVLALIYFGIGRFMLPKIQSTVDARDKRVAEDLEAAQAARTQADEIEAAYRARIDASRAEALKLSAAAKAASARETEARMQSANAETSGRIEAAEARIRGAAEQTLAEIDRVAAEAAREMVERLAGVTVGPDEAERAVRTAMAHG